MRSLISDSPRIIRERIIGLSSRQNDTYCALRNQIKVLLPRLLASHVAIGDEITFPIPAEEAAGAEALILKAFSSGERTSLYLAPIAFAIHPKLDKRGQSFVSALIQGGTLGISSIFLPCETVREYFYVIGASRNGSDSDALYKTLRIESGASPAKIRIAFRLRALELRANGIARVENVKLERAFNILGHPDLRPHYDALLACPDLLPIFPYGGVGSILVAGDRSRNGETFFARRILAFVPDHRHRRFHLPLRHCEFYADKALCRDARRKLQFWLDPALVHVSWDPSWNRWKHLLSTKIEVEGAFVRSGRFQRQGSDWKFADWEIGLPSRLSVKLPTDFREDIERARNTYCRFGQYSRALDQIRLCLEHKALERKDLERMCGEVGIPGDFDIAQINWRPDYDPFYYRELAGRARRTYLFRDEYIFELEKAVVIETPQLGHATYVFSKPANMEKFLLVYSKVGKEDIRHNRDNIAERLGFRGRVIHGTNPRVWLKELSRRFG